MFAPNHPLRRTVTALAIGNVGKRRDAATGGHAGDGHAAEGCCDTHEKPRSHDTSRIASAKLMARVGEEFPFACPNCGGDIRLIAFITEPGPIRKTLTHLGEPLEPPPVSPARGPPTDWGELVQVHDDRNVFQATDRRAARDRYPQPLTRTEREASTKPSGARTRRDSAPTPEKRHFRGKSGFPGAGFGARETGARGSRVSHQSAHACGSAIGRAILHCRLSPHRSQRDCCFYSPAFFSYRAHRPPRSTHFN